jgi:N-methylhydantoinase A
MPKYRIGVDVGGTFTDLVVVDPETAEVKTAKTPSTPSEPGQAIINGLDQLGVPLDETEYFAHGTTVGTNALITRELPRTALICTDGFRDILEIGRGPRPDLWDAYLDIDPPLVKRRDRFEVEGRIDYAGTVLEEVGIDAIAAIGELVAKREITTVAICLLHSYINGEHEQQVHDLLRESFPDLHISMSHEILPEIGEFERSSTTSINAALVPVVGDYLTKLDKDLRGRGFAGDLLVLHSGGGVMQASSVRKLPARVAKSGPAAGAAAMAGIASACGYENALGLDVGGTSSDISLLADGEVWRANETSVTFGHPILFPSVEVATIGAGGGSMAWIDDGGSLRNGPASQRADPGPACYDRGGQEATNTDAQMVLGRLVEEGFLGGTMTVNPQAAVDAIQNKVAEPLGLDVETAAAAIIRVATANMAGATRLITAKKGLDPRDFALVAFGGAGPLFGAELATELGIPTVILPKWPGITSAYGCLVVDARHDLAQTYIARADSVDVKDIDSRFSTMEEDARGRLESEGFADDAITTERMIDMRYLGQWRSLTVNADELMSDPEATLRRFHEEHEAVYSYSQPSQPVEVYGLRVAGIGRVPEISLPEIDDGDGDASDAQVGERRVYFEQAGGFVDTAIYSHERLTAGAELSGPAIIQQMDSTIVVPPTWDAVTDIAGNVILTASGTEPSDAVRRTATQESTRV